MLGALKRLFKRDEENLEFLEEDFSPNEPGFQEQFPRNVPRNMIPPQSTTAQTNFDYNIPVLQTTTTESNINVEYLKQQLEILNTKLDNLNSKLDFIISRLTYLEQMLMYKR